MNTEKVNFINKETGDPLDVSIYERIDSPFTGSTVFFGYNGSQNHLAIKLSAYQEWGPQREWDGLTRAYEHNLPVPKPYFLVTDSEGKTGIVSEKIDGGDLEANPEQSLKKEFGRLVREMHERVPVVGVEWVGTGRQDFSMYRHYLDRFQSSSLESINGRSDAFALLSDLSEATRTENQSIQPVFNHNDLYNQQALLDHNHQLRIFDFEMWREQHPLDDVAKYLFHTLRTGRPHDDFIVFSEGYLNGGKYSDEQKSILAFYLLFTSMRGVDFYSRFRPHEIDLSISYLERAVEYVEKERLWVEQ
jgi:hypothetical protein